jgi:hypothetical protein
MPESRRSREQYVSPQGVLPEPRDKRHPEVVFAWVTPFLDAVATGVSVAACCRAACVDPSTVYHHRRRSAHFRRLWHDAAHRSTRLLEYEAQRRALHGTAKPVFHKGEQCGTVQQYSDGLLMFLLKARRPAVYRDGQDESSTRPVQLQVNLVNVGDSMPIPPVALQPTITDSPPVPIVVVPVSVTSPPQATPQPIPTPPQV